MATNLQTHFDIVCTLLLRTYSHVKSATAAWFNRTKVLHGLIVQTVVKCRSVRQGVVQ